MNTSGTQPIAKEMITELDSLLARVYLINFLEKVPCFVQLWDQARELHGQTFEVLQPSLQKLFVNMSPAGRGAFVAAEGASFNLYNEKARAEATIAWRTVHSINKGVMDFFSANGIDHDYWGQLEALTAPLGVTGLVELMYVHDCHKWGVDRLAHDAGPIDGPGVDLLNNEILRALTGLGPLGFAKEIPSEIKARMAHKAGPVIGHLRRFQLRRRINLWALHVVYGATFAQLADALHSYPGCGGYGDSPEKQVKKGSRGSRDFAWCPTSSRQAAKRRTRSPVEAHD
jgi:hypothetical protein